MLVLPVSVSILDAINTISQVIEIHISNIYSRENLEANQFYLQL